MLLEWTLKFNVRIKVQVSPGLNIVTRVSGSEESKERALVRLERMNRVLRLYEKR